jgi:cbb3-type cytochrome oxidase maturation protein
MIPPVALMLLVGFGLAASAVGAFYWAARHGQFRDLEQGARSIFDADEPVGKPTDQVFRKRASARRTS